MEGTEPEVPRKGQHVSFAAQRELGSLAGLEIIGLEAAPRLVNVLFAGVLKRITETAFDAAPGVDAFLDGDFVGRVLEHGAAGSDIQAFIVFADDSEINILGLLIFNGAVAVVVEFDWAQVDVLLHFEAEAEQDAFFQNSGFHIRMADGAEQHNRELFQVTDGAVGQHFFGAQVPVAAEIEIGVIEFKSKFGSGGVEDLDRLTRNFRACTVANDDCHVVTFHRSARMPGRTVVFN